MPVLVNDKHGHDGHWYRLYRKIRSNQFGACEVKDWPLASMRPLITASSQPVSDASVRASCAKRAGSVSKYWSAALHAALPDQGWRRT